MNILKIKRALAELVWTGALLFAAASVFLRPGGGGGRRTARAERMLRDGHPALFPFLVLSRLLLESRAASALGLLLRPLYPFAWPAQPKGPRSHAVRRAGGLPAAQRRWMFCTAQAS